MKREELTKSFMNILLMNILHEDNPLFTWFILSALISYFCCKTNSNIFL